VLRKHSDLAILAAVMVAVFVIMWLLSGSMFFHVGNFQSMANQLPELGLLSLAMMVTMLTGGINLSIIASANLSGIVAAIILIQLLPQASLGGLGLLVVLGGVLAVLAVSALIGLLNGTLIAVIGVSPILATLGTMILVKGLSIVLTKGYVLAGLPQAILFIGNGDVLGIPMPLIVFAAAVAVMSLILNRTPTGVGIYMIGSNATACRYAGVPNTRVLIVTYLISGLYAGLAALIMIGRFNSAKADYGESYLLLTVLASVLGGVSASGGFGKVSGVVLALVILQVISSGLNLLQVSAFLTIVVWGVILIGVMAVNYLLSRRAERRPAPLRKAEQA
jgi:simple sugar transport system permease protein